MDLYTTTVISITIFPFAFGLYLNFQDWSSLLPLFLISGVSFLLTLNLIPTIKHMTKASGLFGRDLNKVSSKEIPESLGIVPASAYITAIIINQLLYATDKSSQAQYNAAAFSVCFMTFLGFADDVLNLRWRYKLLLPTLASFPLLVAYSGTTQIIIPQPLRDFFGLSLELGLLYHVYMLMLAVFCTNAINIYAGINGIESSQSLVIASAALTHNLIEMTFSCNEQVYKQHLVSFSLILPFMLNTLALIKFNRYPSKVFVGDTYCYFAGMTFAVAGILGHYSKTMLLFFIPQILNFLISLPQLFGIFHCPRHRLPRYNSKDDVLESVPEHHTLINLVLWLVGPTHERDLVTLLTGLQVLSCGFAFYVRYHVSTLFYCVANSLRLNN